MSSFIRNMSKIKMTKIAKENKMDYSNIIKEKAKKEDLEFFDKEIKKKIVSLLLYDYLTDTEKESITNIKTLLTTKIKENEIYYTIDQKDINDILIILKILGV